MYEAGDINDLPEELRGAIGAITSQSNRFQRYQDASLNQRHYHEVLKGTAYEKLNRFANVLNDFTDNGYVHELDQRKIEMYRLRKHTDEFTDELRADQLSRTGVCALWIREVDQLKKIEDRIQANQLKPEQITELHQQYRQKFLQIQDLLYEIVIQDELESGVGEEKTSFEITEPVRARFRKFSRNNRINRYCGPADLDPAYFKLIKLMNLVSDFQQVCDLQQDANGPTRLFLADYDRRKHATLEKELKTLIAADYSDLSEDNFNQIMKSIRLCRNALEHLQLRNKEVTEEPIYAIMDLADALPKLHAQGKTIDPGFTDEVYISRLRELQQNLDALMR